MSAATSFAARLANTARVARASLGERRIAFRPRAELERLQAARVRALVGFAYDRVPHYRDAWRDLGVVPGDIRGAGDLARLPLVDKLELTLRPERFSPPGADALDGITLLSSGTSGMRRRLRHDRDSVLGMLAAGRRQRLVLARFVGREGGYREANLHRPGSVALQLRAWIEMRTLAPPGVELTRATFCPTLPFADLRARIEAFAPAVLRGYGSHLGAFFRWLRDSGAPPPGLRAIVFGGDAMPPPDRELIERELGIPVLSTYQAVEALRIGFECEARRGFHVCSDQVVVRVVDAQGRDVGPGGRGELVLSNLVNRATVVLNYRLGDIVTLGDGPCACGRTMPLIRGIDGRADDLIARPDGTRMPAIVLLPFLQAVAGVRQVRVDQCAFDRFEVKVVPEPGGRYDEAGIRAAFRDRVGPSLDVAIATVDALPPEPSGKTKSFASRVGTT